MKVLSIAIVGAVVVIGLAVWLLLSGSQSEQLPGSKIMADTMAHLMEMERLLEQKSAQIEETPGESLKLCNCCNSTLVGGVCPICQGECDNSTGHDAPSIPDILYREIQADTGKPDFDDGDRQDSGDIRK